MGSAQPFIVWTDHKNLAYAQGAKRLNLRPARWSCFLLGYIFLFPTTQGPKTASWNPSRVSLTFWRKNKYQNPSFLNADSVTWGVETVVKEALRRKPDAEDYGKESVASKLEKIPSPDVLPGTSGMVVNSSL